MTNRNSTAAQLVSDLVVRAEREADADGIGRVLTEAFGNEAEANLVQALRANGALRLSLVGCVDGKIVGHVALSPMHAEGQPDRGDLLGMAPVAVRPNWQHHGIGSAIVQHSLNECRKRAVAAVFVLGNPLFYGRFGFIPARVRAFRCKYEAAVPDAFQLLLLSDAGALPPTGLICYRPEFDSLS